MNGKLQPFLMEASVRHHVILDVSFAGNLLNRTLGLLKKNCQSTLVVDSSAAAVGNAFKEKVEELVRSTWKLYWYLLSEMARSWRNNSISIFSSLKSSLGSIQ